MVVKLTYMGPNLTYMGLKLTSLKLKAIVLPRGLRDSDGFLFRRDSFSTLPDWFF